MTLSASKNSGKFCPELRTTIIVQHAESLAAMTRWFKAMIEERGLENAGLTAAYCDELIEDLEQQYDYFKENKNGKKTN